MFSFSNRLSILRRRGLAYPAGFAPGFDPSHVALIGLCRLSAIASGNNFINLFSGARGTAGGAATSAGIDGSIGPCVNYPNANISERTTFVLPAVTDSNFTLAAIFRLSITGTFQPIFGTGASSVWTTLAIRVSGLLSLQNSATQNASSGFTMSAGVPYFAAASQNGTSAVNFIVVRLDTGQSFTSSVTAGLVSNPATDSQAMIGNYANVGTPNSPTSGLVSTVAYIAGFLSLPILRIWAADPWSFWYPSPQSMDMQQLVGRPAGTPPAPLIASGYAETIW
jgi:hypothetical protein